MEKDLYNGQRWDPRKGPRGPDKTGKAISAKKAKTDALDLLNKSSNKVTEMFVKPTVFSDESGSHVLGKDGNIKASFTVADHGASHEGAAVAHLQQNFDNYMGEESDLPWDEDPKNPTRKSGERKDEHGNPVKNVARHLARKAMKNMSEAENKQYIEVTHVSGEKSKKPVHPDNAFKALNHYRSLNTTKSARIVSEDVEQVNEARFSHRDYASHGLMHPDMAKGMTIGKDMDYYLPGNGDKHSGRVVRNDGNIVHMRAEKDGKIGAGPLHKFKVTPHLPTNEEVEQVNELSTNTLDSYRNKARNQIIAARNKDTDTTEKRLKGYTKASGKIQKNFVKGVDEEAEQIDELSKGTMGRYINRAATKMGSQGVTAGLKIAADEKSSKQFKDMGKREKGIKLAVSKLTKEDAELEEKRGLWDNIHDKQERIKHGSGEHMRKPGSKGAPTAAALKASQTEAATNPYAVGMAAAMKSTGDKPPLEKSTIVKAHKIAKEVMKENKFLAGAIKKLEEGRGRPAKEGSAAWHRQQAEKEPDEEPEAIGMQLRKAKSINKPVTFNNKETKEIHPKHISAFNDHMAHRRTTQEKHAFQKKASASHDAFVKAVSEPLPAHSKDTGEIIRYRH